MCLTGLSVTWGSKDLPDWFWDNVTPEPNTGCWLWLGPSAGSGYGGWGTDKAHRVAYALVMGCVPAGKQIDHLCRVTWCCRPDHLEAVTQLENVRRGNAGKLNAAKTHCPKGHPYEGDNLRVVINDCGRPTRRCLACSQRKKHK